MRKIKKDINKLRIETYTIKSKTRKIIIKTFIIMILCILYFFSGYLLGSNGRILTGKNHIMHKSSDNPASFTPYFDIYLKTRDITNIPYEKDVFDCSNYTELFLKRVNELGAYCQNVVGCPKEKEKSCHEWVRCDIDPQSLDFVNYNDVYPSQWVDSP